MGSADMEMYRALIAGGIGEEQASRIAEAMCTQQTVTKQDIDKLDQKINRLGERLDCLEERIDRLGERLDCLEERIDRLDQRVHGLDERVHGLELKFTRQLVRLEVLLGLVAAGVAAQLVQQFFR